MRALLASLALAALAGCGMTKEREPPPKPFFGTRWEAMLELPVSGEQPWIRMGDGRLEGFAGCNRVNARFLQDTVGARAIAFGQISTSRRPCDEGAVSAERRFLEVLHGVSSYQVSGDLLAMSGSAGTLRFRAVSDVASASVDIANTSWLAAADESTQGNVPRLDFSGDGRLNGYTGCNSLSGSYSLVGDRLEVTVATTKRGCAGKGADFERQLLAILAEGPRVTIAGNRLSLTGVRSGKIEMTALSRR